MNENMIEQARRDGYLRGLAGVGLALGADTFTLAAAVDVIAQRWMGYTRAEKIRAFCELGLIDGPHEEVVSDADGPAEQAFREGWRQAVPALIERHAEMILITHRGPAYAAGVADGLNVRTFALTPPRDCRDGKHHDEYMAGYRDGEAALIAGEDSDDEHPALQTFP